MDILEIVALVAPWAGAGVSFAAAARARAEGAHAAQATIAELRRMLEEQIEQVERLRGVELECKKRLEVLESGYEDQQAQIAKLTAQLRESERRARRIADELDRVTRDITAGTHVYKRQQLQPGNGRNDD